MRLKTWEDGEAKEREKAHTGETKGVIVVRILPGKDINIRKTRGEDYRCASGR